MVISCVFHGWFMDVSYYFIVVLKVCVSRVLGVCFEGVFRVIQGVLKVF